MIDHFMTARLWCTFCLARIMSAYWIAVQQAIGQPKSGRVDYLLSLKSGAPLRWAQVTKERFDLEFFINTTKPNIWSTRDIFHVDRLSV